MLTCKECVYNNGNVNPAKEIVRQCTRFPPKMFLLPSTNGIISHISYPVISNDLVACGEYFDGVDEEDDAENMKRTLNTKVS